MYNVLISFCRFTHCLLIKSQRLHVKIYFATSFCYTKESRFAIWSLDLALRDFAFFKHSFLCKNRLFKRVSYLLICVIREKEIFISVIHDRLFVPFVHRVRDLPVRPSSLCVLMHVFFFLIFSSYLTPNK